jgi:hypothetical protein
MKIQLTIKDNIQIHDAFDAVLIVSGYSILDEDRDEFGYADYFLEVRDIIIKVTQFYSKKGNNCYIVKSCTKSRK